MKIYFNINKKVYIYFIKWYNVNIVRNHGTSDGNYLSNDPISSKYTEVFRKENNGTLRIIWSGKLQTNPGIYDENCLDCDKCFSIFSFDSDTSASFKQDFELKTAPIELQNMAIEGEKRVVQYINSLLNEQTTGKHL